MTMRKVMDLGTGDGAGVLYEGTDDSITLCKKNGWGPGTRLVGDEGYGPTVIEITAVGREHILAIVISHNGHPEKSASESTWTLEFRDWREVNPPSGG